MSNIPIQVLLVEDNVSDARLILHELQAAGFSVTLERIETKSEFLTHLKLPYDVILCDYNLPQFDALTALRLVREQCPHLPFMIVSGSIGEDIAVEAIKLGATDYLIKDRLARLGPAVRQALKQAQLRSAEQQAQQALADSERQYRMLADSIPQIVWTANPGGAIEYLNHRAMEYAAVDFEDLIGWSWEQVIHPDDLPATQSSWHTILTTGVPHDLEFRIRRADGMFRWHIARQVPLRDAAGNITRWFGSCTDIHDQKTAAAAVRKSEARFRALVEQAADAILLFAPDHSIADANHLACANLGYSRAELLQLKATEIDLNFSPGNMAQCAASLESGERVTIDSRHRRKDGSTFPVELRLGQIEVDGQSHVLVMARDVTVRNRTEGMLATVLSSVVDAILTIDARGTITSINPAGERLFGYPAEALLGENIKCLMPSPFRDEHDQYLANYHQTGLAKIIGSGREVVGQRKDGSTFPADLAVTECWLDGCRYFTGVVRDITERKKLEEQFRQAQKMEAIGRLAGGVAHDFNNLLTVINGFSEILLAGLESSDPRRDSLTAILDAGERAAGLTQQLLAFSRKTLVEPKVLDLNEVVDSIGRMLRRLIGEDITLLTLQAPKLSRVRVDPSQMEQVIINLAVNARDAMPSGGRLCLQTRDVELRPGEVPLDQDSRPGRYVELSVADNGSGMSEDIRAKAFEPFFTTKGPGKGTGLGLATVYGIVKQAGGLIGVTSQVGAGTTFKIYLPALVEAAPAAPPNLVAPVLGCETVLLVEDEDSVRRLARIALETQGYVVLEAARGTDALQFAEQHPGRIHLLITDVVMPEMGGRDLANAVRQLRPAIQVLYISGYTDDAVFRTGVLEASDLFLQKPFTPLGLARKARSVLDSALRSDQ